jgi:anti-sigma regulatory factor (Ser/Thr protein kinase)
MVVATRDIPVDGGDHSVHFYEHDWELARTVSGYLVDAVDSGAVAVVLATEAHGRAFAAELASAGIDADEASHSGTLVLLDAAATMAKFMPGGRIDARACRRVLDAIVSDAAATGRPVRAYGEMVALLWEAGDILAAIELEKLWNELGREHRFALLCAYRHQSGWGSERTEALRQICHQHSCVVAEASGRFSADSGGPAAARRLVAEALREWGHHGVLLDDAQLVLSELATNAVIHAGTPFSVMVRSQDSGLRLSVRDSSPTRPTVRELEPMSISGRGLRLVKAVADDWGAELTTDGKTVWAELRT